MKTSLISWNVNGLRSVLGKGKDGKKLTKDDPLNNPTNNVLTSLLQEQDPDILCLQEIRCNADLNLTNTALSALGYNHISLNFSKAKKGYSGTAIFSKVEPLSIQSVFPNYPIGHEINNEGRILVAEFQRFFLINLYVPNSKGDLSRLPFRVDVWEASVRALIKTLKANTSKHIILCGDLNVAPKDIDVHNPKTAKGAHGFTDEEKGAFQRLLIECDLVDTFRELHPTRKQYTWFSPFAKCRQRNIGWRIDAFLASSAIKNKIRSSEILMEYYGSDHVPIKLAVDL